MKEYLRKATKADTELLFQWANEPLVRQNSFSQKEIAYEEHKKWFRRLLECQDRSQYIYIYEGEPIGQVRIKIEGDQAKISYSICKEKRGQGHGKMLLRLLCEQVKNDFPEVRTLVGEVKPENRASQETFKRAGFGEKYYMYELSLDNLV